MNTKTKTIIALALTGAAVYVAYRYTPRIFKKSGCNGKVCEGYSCSIVNKWFDSRFPNNVDDAGNYIHTDKCKLEEYRQPTFMAMWADAILSKSKSFKVKNETYCTGTGNNVTDPNSGSTNGVCPSCVFAGITDCEKNTDYCKNYPKDC